EQYKARVQAGTLETQRLLIPEPIDLTAEQAARLLEQRAALAELGLGVEEFGGGTVLLTTYPVLLGKRAPRAVLQAVVDHLCTQAGLRARGVCSNALLGLRACHRAARAGESLTPDERAPLVARRDLGEAPHGPPGRPTGLLFPRHDLERQFRRA